MIATRKLTFIVLVVVFVLSAIAGTVGAQDSTPRIWLSSNAEQLTTGQEVTITVNIAGANAVYGGSFVLTYDPAMLEALPVESKAVAPGGFFNEGQGFPLKNTADPITGIVEYALTLMQPAQPISGDGVFGTVTFRALVDGTPAVNIMEARLLAPEFTEVDGRLIAQKINEVVAQVEGLNAAPIATAPVVQAQPDVAVASVSVPVSAPDQNMDQGMNLAAVSAALLFVLIGVGFFGISVMMYTNLRRSNAKRLQEHRATW